MASSRPKSCYRRGVREGVPFVFVVVPFAMFFGLIATEAGMSVGQTFGFSAVVIAGAAQFAALQLMTEGAPAAGVIATALAVNLRMAMYSASLAPHLGAAPLGQRLLIAYLNVDQAYAMSMVKYETEPELSVPEKVAYFLGVATPVLPTWYAGTLVGALAGQAVPETFSLEFTVPVAFLAIVALMLRTRAHWAAAATSVGVALTLGHLPLNLGLLFAGLAAMAVGAVTETLIERRA